MHRSGPLDQTRSLVIAYLRFLRRHGRRVGFGFSTSFFSSFGQTFFISLFVPFLLVELDLTAGGFGTLYSLATLGSALLLPYLGALYDRVPLRRYSLAVVIGLGAACLSMAAAFNVALLWLGLWGLRLSGQGLLSHVSMTTMAQAPAGDRGKALGAASLGYPSGEGLLPPLAAVTIAWVGWRETWFAASAFAFLFLLPLLLWLAGPLGRAGEAGGAAAKVERRGAAWWLFRDAAFLCILPSVWVLAAVSTAIFLYQLPMAESKGWKPEWIAAGLAVFATARALTSVFAGGLLDRIGSMPLLPLGLLPYAGGLVLLLWADAPWVIPVYLAMFGVTFGVTGVVKTAVWVELYGTGELGAIRSMLAMLMTLGTAASPVAVGLLLDQGVTFGVVIGLSLAATLLATIPLLAVPRLQRRRSEAGGH